MFAGLLFTFGVLGDRTTRRRRTLIIGMALFGVFSLLTAYSRNLGPADLRPGGHGPGRGRGDAPDAVDHPNVFEPRERARAIGIWALAVASGLPSARPSRPLLAHFWWGSVFLINVLVTAIGVAAIAMLVPES